MTLEQVRHVLEVEKAKSINQAANNMFLSQSALSLSIKGVWAGHFYSQQQGRGAYSFWTYIYFLCKTHPVADKSVV